MAESLICSTTDTTKTPIFQRRIEFHPARKPFTGFTTGSSDFHLETLNPNTNTSSSGSSGSSQKPASFLSAGKKSDSGDLLEQYGLDPEISFGNTFRRIGAGLENLGNTCFLNSVLQCLTYTEPFAAYLQSGKHKSSCRMAGFCALCAIQNHVKRALQSTGRILAPKDLVMNLRCISRSFRNARQEDAHEYMVNLLESMHKCCLPSGVPSESPSAYEKSLVHKIFGGRLRSQVKCMQCSYCSDTFDPFLDLSLEIVKADSLGKALAHFTATELLDGGQRQYQCGHCKQKVKALKQLTVHKAPYVLTIHLKRFGSHNPGQKIDKKVAFGSTLDLKPFVSGSHEGGLKYTLYGVLVHAGWSTHSGHYYCFARTSSGMWHLLDDNRVVQVSEKTVLEQKAYMLFYVRDRKIVAPRKPVDVISKENVVPSAFGNKGNTASIASANKADQTCPTTRALSDCSTGVAQRDALCGDPLKKLQVKDATFVSTKGMVVAEGPALVKDSPAESLQKDLAKGLSTKGQFMTEDFRQSTPSLVKNSCSNLNPLIATGGAKISMESVNRGSNGVPDDAPCAVPNCSGSQSSSPKHHVLNSTVQKVGVENEGTTTVPSKDIDDLKDENKGSVRSLNRSGLENNQKECERGLSEQPQQKVKENRSPSEETGLAEISTQLNMENGFVEDIPQYHHNHKKLLKPKKKLMKYQIASMNFGSKLLLKASMSSCRKRKHKKNKRRRIELEGDVQEYLIDGSVSGDLGPSTSENTRDIVLASTDSKKSGKKKTTGRRATKDARDSNGESAMNGISSDPGERIDQNNTDLATKESPEKSISSTIAAKQFYLKEPVRLQEKRGEHHNGLISMLTNGLVETTVPRWDETTSSPSLYLGSHNARSLSIGYVPDEWDEEYDRGKRKKVRNSKNDFGGPNLFQEVATMKAQSKKAKMDKISSGNQPFRI